MPWQPGNPGRPSNWGGNLERAIRRRIGEDGENAVDIVWDLALGTPDPVDQSRPSKELRAACAKWLMDRCFGRAAQTLHVDTTHTNAPPVDLSRLSTEQLMQFRDLYRKALPVTVDGTAVADATPEPEEDGTPPAVGLKIVGGEDP